MKKILLAFLFISSNVVVNAQGLGVNSTGGLADPSAMLDVFSSNKGVLFPRMSLAQRLAIANPATGLLVFQVDGVNGFYYNVGSPAVPNWVRLSAENYWSTTNGVDIFNNNSGFVGIGTNNPVERLHVVSTGPNIATFSGANNMYITLAENGSPKGYIGSFNQSVTSDDVDFGTFSGTSGALHLTTQGFPRLTVSNSGNIGVSNTTPNAPLQFATDTRNRKIVLFEVANNDHEFYGFGVNGGVLRYQAGTGVDNHVFYAGTSATTSNELMRITGAGNVGIGGITPAFRLDVNGRMRIRDGGGGNTAGLWLNNAANTASPAFIGMENDNSVGIFGNPSSGWSFTMNTTTGKVKIADGTQANGRVLTSDANGTASWTQLNSTQSVRTGSLGGGVNFDYSEMGSFPTGGTSKYTTVNITLPPGRWVVFANLLINGTALPAGGGIFIRTYLAESTTVGTGTTDIVPGTGGLISGNFSYSNTFTFVSGQIFVNNASGANKTYYLWALGARNASAPATGSAIGALGSSFWAENQLFAIPMN